MTENKEVAELARALSDPLRLAILRVLISGPAMVAELVSATGASQSNVSNHLRVLRERGLVEGVRRGRRTVYEVSDASVTRLVESLTSVAGGWREASPGTGPLAAARTCYDHLAGGLGVALYESLVGLDALRPADEARGDVSLGPAAREVLGGLGLDPYAIVRGRRRFAYACPDWTEREPHLGGALGAALCGRFFEEGWVRRVEGTRAVELTREGEKALARELPAMKAFKL
jgi:DNA-binding transcriptional ArsR family regulator